VIFTIEAIESWKMQLCQDARTIVVRGDFDQTTKAGAAQCAGQIRAIGLRLEACHELACYLFAERFAQARAVDETGQMFDRFVNKISDRFTHAAIQKEPLRLQMQRALRSVRNC
jgi:hypothetical protein